MAQEPSPIERIEKELAGISARRAADRPAALDAEREVRLRVEHRRRKAAIELHGLGQIPEHRITDSQRRQKAACLAVVNAPREQIIGAITAEDEAAEVEQKAAEQAEAEAEAAEQARLDALLATDPTAWARERQSRRPAWYGRDAQHLYDIERDLIDFRVAQAIESKAAAMLESYEHELRQRDGELEQRIANAEAATVAAEQRVADAADRAKQIVAAAEKEGTERFDFHARRGAQTEAEMGERAVKEYEQMRERADRERREILDAAHMEGARIMSEARAAVASLKESH